MKDPTYDDCRKLAQKQDSAVYVARLFLPGGKDVIEYVRIIDISAIDTDKLWAGLEVDARLALRRKMAELSTAETEDCSGQKTDDRTASHD